MRVLTFATAALSAALCSSLFAATCPAQGWLPADALRAGDEEILEKSFARRGSIDCVETPLASALADVSRQFGVPIVIATKKLEEAGVSTQTPITKVLNNLPLESILRLVLRDVELTFTIRENVLLVTSPEDAEGQLLARVYPVLDLLVPRGLAASVSMSSPNVDYDSLIEVIKATIAPDSWDDVGGPGAIDALDNAAALVVLQTLEVHRALQGLLRALREARQRQGIPALAISPARGYRELPYAPRSVQPVSPQSVQPWQLPHVHPTD